MSITRSGFFLALAALLVVGVMAFPFVSSAQSADVQALINSLLQQVRALQAQLAAIIAAQGGGGGYTTGGCQFTRDLAFGAQGNDVSCLQQLLARDPSVYPEGNVTGYFGSLTMAAVQRYQLKYALPVNGVVDYRTQQDLASRYGGGQIIPPPPPPAVTNLSLTANPSSVTAGSNTIITWSSQNMTSCSVSGPNFSYNGTAGSQSTGGLYSTSTYIINCVRTDGGQESRTVTVTVVPAPTITLVANPTSVVSGQSSVITWNSQGTSSCAVTGPNFAYSGTSGNQPTGPLTSASTYTLVCNKTAGGTDTRTVTVTVEAATNLTLTASPSEVAYNGSATLTWSAQNVSSCRLVGPNRSLTGISGSTTTGNLTADATYTLTCTKSSGGSETKTVVVEVAGKMNLTLTATPSIVAPNAVATLKWTSTNATSCKLSGTGVLSDGPTSGTLTTSALTADTTFTLDCVGPGGGRETKTAKVIVQSDVEVARAINTQLKTMRNAFEDAADAAKLTKWWSETSFGAGADPTVAKVIAASAGIKAKLPVAPVPPVTEGGNYIYDNDGNTYACNGTVSSGVNIVLPSVRAGVLTELERLIDGDSKPNCGRFTYLNGTFYYKLSNANAYFIEPTADIRAAKDKVITGTGTTVTWSIKNPGSVVSCQVTKNGVAAASGFSGTISTGNLTADATYRVTCAKKGYAGGTITDSVLVNVVANNPRCTFRADPASSKKGIAVKLIWTSTDARSVTIDQGVGSVTPVASGSVFVYPSVTTKYTAAIDGRNGTDISCSATVTKI